MEFVYDVVVVLHFVGLAILLGAVLLQLTSPEKTVTRWMFDGALTQLVTGLIMVGMLSGGLLGDEAKEYVDHTKIAVKLVIVLVIAVLAFVGKKRPAPQTVLWATIGVLTLANVVIAVFW